MLTRRQAAVALLGAGAAASPTRQGWAQVVHEEPEAGQDQTPTAVDTVGGRYEHMLAPVTINGQGPFNFLMDTGANISCVSQRLAEKLKLTPGPPANVHTVVGVRSRPSVVIDSLQVGARNRRQVRAPSLPIKGTDVDGVLGVDWLKGQRLVLGFKQKNLEITKSRLESSHEGRVIVPAKRRLGQLTIVDAELSGKPISAIIDSGSQVTICNRPLLELVRAAERRRGVIEKARPVRLESLAGESFMGETLYLPFLRLGGLHLGNVQVVYADTHVFKVWGMQTAPALVLGMDLLTQFDSVALDFGRSNVRFDYT
ncbi:retroviral-like aspartic protease family protein [Phenylobacterium sp.]|uniref:retroviral-like aspartic protease family protein n=1 Tax=Phenylobacterium sp. TaxID=1871053 RepID=UPI003983D8AB